MKDIPFTKAQFIKSALMPEDYPRPLKPEIAFVGRSNVGKSSLINHLLQSKKIAKVSATPGKTQLLNFFHIDEKLILVDCPGYGFAKVPEEIKNKWSVGIDHYLTNRKELQLIIFLLDIRRLPSNEDQTFIKWATYHQKPLLIVFTKSDKITLNQQNSNAKKNLNVLFPDDQSISYLQYSIHKKNCRTALIQHINQKLQNGTRT